MARYPIHDQPKRQVVAPGTRHRHNAEAVLNSVGHVPGTLVPWLQMCAVGSGDPPARLADDFTLPEETGQLLSMLRAKNIKEGLFYTGWYGRRGSDGLPDASWAANMHATWESTQNVIRDVYESRVHTYRFAAGSNRSTPSRRTIRFRSSLHAWNSRSEPTDRTRP